MAIELFTNFEVCMAVCLFTNFKVLWHSDYSPVLRFYGKLNYQVHIHQEKIKNKKKHK